MSRRYALNPCDYLYFAHHTMMRRCKQSGSMVLMTLELRGEIDPARVKRALDLAMRAHPVLRSRARLSPIMAWPSWQPVARTESPAFVHHDLRESPDWAAQADELMERLLGRPADVFRSPQIRVELYTGPRGHLRLCLSWPHPVMDAEGGQWLIREMDRLDCEPASLPPPGLTPDDALIDPLAGYGWLRRLGLFRRGLRAYQTHESASLATLGEGPAEGGRWRVALRRWDGDAWQELRQRAERWCPTGPVRFGRYLGGCVLRALQRVLLLRGIDAEACLATLPMRCPGVADRRPMRGNYLVSATLAGRRGLMSDKRALMDDLGRQLDEFLSTGGDRANWALLWMAGSFREPQYRWYLGARGLQPYASGFSYYVNSEPAITSFLGATVANVWGAGTMIAPPGWNPVFSRAGDRLTLALAWLEGYHRRETAMRYRELIEAELFDRA